MFRLCMCYLAILNMIYVAECVFIIKTVLCSVFWDLEFILLGHIFVSSAAVLQHCLN